MKFFSESSSVYEVDVLAYDEQDDQVQEICRFATGCIRNWFDKEDKERFRKKRAVAVKLPKGTKEIDLCYMPLLIQGDDKNVRYKYLWQASKNEVKYGKPCLGRFSLDKKGNYFFDGLANLGRDRTSDFMEIFDEFYLIYFPPKETGMPTTECSGRIPEKTERIRKEIDRFVKDPLYGEKTEEMNRKILNVVRSFATSVGNTDMTVLRYGAEYAYRATHKGTQDEEVPEEFLFKFCLRAIPGADAKILKHLDEVTDEYFIEKRLAEREELLSRKIEAEVEEELIKEEQLAAAREERKRQLEEKDRRKKEEREIREEIKAKKRAEQKAQSGPESNPKQPPESSPNTPPTQGDKPKAKDNKPKVFTGTQVKTRLLCKGLVITEIPAEFLDHPYDEFTVSEIKAIMGRSFPGKNFPV